MRFWKIVFKFGNSVDITSLEFVGHIKDRQLKNAYKILVIRVFKGDKQMNDDRC